MGGCYRKDGYLVEVSMLLSKSLERQTAEACLLTALPSAGATNPLFEIESAQCSLVFATKAQLFPVPMRPTWKDLCSLVFSLAVVAWEGAFGCRQKTGPSVRWSPGPRLGWGAPRKLG